MFQVTHTTRLVRFYAYVVGRCESLVALRSEQYGRIIELLFYAWPSTVVSVSLWKVLCLQHAINSDFHLCKTWVNSSTSQSVFFKTRCPRCACFLRQWLLRINLKWQCCNLFDLRGLPIATSNKLSLEFCHSDLQERSIVSKRIYTIFAHGSQSVLHRTTAWTSSGSGTSRVRHTNESPVQL